MEYTQIDASVLGISKPVSVPLTQGNVRKSMVVMRTLTKYEVDKLEPKKTTAAEQEGAAYLRKGLKKIDDTLKFMSDIDDFVVQTLQLSETQRKKLDSLSFNDLGILAGIIAAKVLGTDDKEPTEDDRKSDAEQPA